VESAGLLMAMSTPVVAFLLLQRSFIKGITLTGIKG